MIRSMTGFGQSGRRIPGFRMQVEVRSVNHRYAETSVKINREWLSLEDGIKKLVARDIKRGRADVYVTVEPEGQSGKKLVIDWELASAYMEAANQLKAKFGLTDEPRLEDLLKVPELLHPGESVLGEPAFPEQELMACVEEAAAQLSVMRMAEGAHLHEDLIRRLAVLDGHLTDMKAISAEVVGDYSRKLAARIQELLPQDAVMDTGRLEQEIALMADRCSIDEELTRLASHMAQFSGLLDAEEPVGRKLDFLIQEMNREVNTVGSKANRYELSKLVVELKAELEKIREQVQNIE